MSSSCCCRDFCQTGQRTSARNSTTKTQDACQALDLLFSALPSVRYHKTPPLPESFSGQTNPSIDKFIDKLSSKSIKRPPTSEPRRTLRLRQQESKSAAGLARNRPPGARLTRGQARAAPSAVAAQANEQAFERFRPGSAGRSAGASRHGRRRAWRSRLRLAGLGEIPALDQVDAAGQQPVQIVLLPPPRPTMRRPAIRRCL